MQLWRIKLLIWLMAALAVANAQCSANCLTQFGNVQATHCHQKPGHCPLQHDLKVASAPSVAAEGLVALAVETPDVDVQSMPPVLVEAHNSSPPSVLRPTAPLPLRV
jgi:hypothetical protein